MVIPIHESRAVVRLIVVTILGAASLFALYGSQRALAQEDAISDSRPRLVERAQRKRFYVERDRDSDSDYSREYCQEIVRRTGIARLASSRSAADYLLYPSLQFDRRLTRKDHTKTIEYEYYNDKGEKKKKEEQKVMHRDDVLTVTTRFECRVVRVDSDGENRDVVRITGQNSRSTRGPDTPGHNADDPRIRIYEDDVPRLTRPLIQLEGNSGEGALYRAIFGLCNVQAPVTDVDYKMNRLSVPLGVDDGIQPKDYPAGVTEMEIYAQTQKLRDYTYFDPYTGRLFAVDRRSADARPDSPETWAYVQADALPNESKLTITGPDAKALVPLGEKISDWAEVAEVRADSCTVALKKKADYGRTVDDMNALKRVPDPHTTPVIARVRAKRGFLSR